MKKSSHRNRVAPKGDRLNWTPLKDVSPVKLTPELTKGKVLTSLDLSKRGNSNKSNLLLP